MKLLRGTSIIEILIATAMISVAVIAALSLMNRSQSQNTYARNLSEATRYNTQAADWIRTQRDTLGFATIYAQNQAEYCFNTLPTGNWPGPCASGTTILGTKYQRKITLTKPTADTIKFVITVSWTDRALREAKVEMELNKW